VKDLNRALVYILVTGLIQGPSILILYSLGFPNSTSGWFGSLPFFIVFNFAIILFFGAAHAPYQAPVDPNVYLIAGTVSLLITITVIGEGINWLSAKVGELVEKKEEQPSKA
jgi:hypothetical protein